MKYCQILRLKSVAVICSKKKEKGKYRSFHNNVPSLNRLYFLVFKFCK